MTPDPNSVFDNRVDDHTVHVTLERDATTLMRLLELFALRGTLPLQAQFDAHAGPAGAGRLRVRARLGTHDWNVLCARAATLVGVIELTQGVPPGEAIGERAALALADA